MSNSAPTPLHDGKLASALDRVRGEFRPVLLVLFVLGAVLVVGHLLYAIIRSQMHAVAVPARSDLDVAVFFTVLVFWTVTMCCLGHLMHWLSGAFGYRAGHLLSAPAVIASASARRGPESTSQAIEDVSKVNEILGGKVRGYGVELLLMPLLILLLMTLHWAFMILAAVCVLVRLGLALLSERMLLPALRRANERHVEVMAAMADGLNAAEAIEAMGMAPNLARNWTATISADAAEMERLQRRMRWVDGASTVVDAFISPAPIILMAFMTLMGGDVGVGVGIGAHIAVSIVVQPFSGLSGLLLEWSNFRMAWERLRKLADRQRQRSRDSGVFLCSEGRLEVDRLTVLLPGMPQPIIRDMSFRLAPGQVLSLAGPVGCGKSTILRSIMGIQAPSAGGCYLDGHATAQWDPLDLSRHIGFLPQDVGLTSGTVADMIARLGPPDMAMVLDAAQRAGAHEMIVGLPRGYSTRLTEHAVSAGQRQRLALARAIYGRPRLLVLDEPGAWLDAQGLAHLRGLIALLRREGTSVVFSSHEPGLLEEADHGIVLGSIGNLPRATSRPRLTAANPQEALA